MNKFKYILGLFALSFLVLNSCGDNNTGVFVDDFDHEAQALIDNDSLTQFLKNYYFDTSIDSIKPLVTGKTSLFDNVDGKLKEMNVTESDVNYTLYVYVIEEGGKDSNSNVINSKGFPTVMDSILSKYQLWNMNRTDTISLVETGTTPIWWNLAPSLSGAATPIRGWAHGFTKFIGGENITDNGPITYENFGRGIIFLPSGLAYRNLGSLTIAGNQNLIFYVSLYDIVQDTDHDNDGKPSILEDADGDGDPRNDFSDDSNPTLPDYLNPNIN